MLDIHEGDAARGSGSTLAAGVVVVALVHLGDLGLGVVDVVGVAVQGDGVAMLGLEELDWRGLGEGQDGSCKSDECGELHGYVFFLCCCCREE